MSRITDTFRPGQRVRIKQQIPQRDDVWVTQFDGEVIKAEQRKTGSWYAHSKDDKLWLDRLVIRKDDGEMTHVNLDQYTHVELLEDAVSSEQSDDS